MKVRPAIGGFAVLMLCAAAGAKGSEGETPTRSRAVGDAYALIVNGNWRSAHQSIEEMNVIHDRIGADFLWFRRRGKSYLVLDHRRLKEAQGLLNAALRVVDQEREALAREREVLDRREEDLESERDRIEGGHVDKEATRPGGAAQRRLKEIDAALRRIESENRGLDKKESALDRRNRRLDRTAEGKLWALADEWIANGTARRSEGP